MRHQRSRIHRAVVGKRGLANRHPLAPHEQAMDIRVRRGRVPIAHRFERLKSRR
jgi:hypothetical protein